MSFTPPTPRLVIAHLFPDLLNLYGDRGNIAALTQRARWRGIEVEIRAVDADDGSRLAAADIVFIGGGQDHQQIAVARGLERLGRPLHEAVARGASLVAVCGGYQNVGHGYRSVHVGDLVGPGLLDVWTDAPPGANRIVGDVAVNLQPDSPIVAIGRDSAARAGFDGEEQTIVGFENHSGRTLLGPGAQPLGQVLPGHGNTGQDGGEGAIALPGSGGLAGLRIGTYLHGPVLPRNPHLADFVLACAVARHGMTSLPPLPDDHEWAAHATRARAIA
jgi:CobQ-like glutamine amidotransferase family enzyme